MDQDKKNLEKEQIESDEDKQIREDIEFDILSLQLNKLEEKLGWEAFKKLFVVNVED